MRRAPSPKHPAILYATQVLEGALPAGPYVRLACQRQLRDLAEGHKRGLVFSEGHADHALDFIEALKHSTGEWAGQPLRLGLWQKFIIGSTFGWLAADGYRRFSTSYNEVPRKNGKTTLAAGVGNYCFLADEEPGAQVYSTATKRDQAKLCWKEARQQILLSPPLRRRVKTYVGSLEIPGTPNIFQPLSADATTADGFNPHCTVNDELHAHKDRRMVDVMETGEGARQQSLRFEITTSGANRLSVCYEHHRYSVQLLQERWTDEAADAWFAYIATVNNKKKWDQEEEWAAANPNYGVSVLPKKMRIACAKAKRISTEQNAFLQKRLDIWTQVAERWLNRDLWDAAGGAIDPEALAGRDCYGGLDLGRVDDLSALVLLFPPEVPKGLWEILCWFWCPEVNIEERTKAHAAPYETWHKEGFIEPTPGNATDYDFIEKRVLAIMEIYNLLELAYDRTFAGGLITNLAKEEVPVVPFGQGYISMAAPCHELERLLLATLLRHGDHPILSWCADNVVVSKDAAGNKKPDKDKSTEKIDGIVALLMALGRALLHGGEDESAYDQGQEVLLI